MDLVLKRYRVYYLLIFFLLISFSGCAWIPLWDDRDEEEVELESDLQEFEEIEGETPLGMEDLQEEVADLRIQQESAQLKIEDLEDTVSTLAPRLKEIEELKQEDSVTSQIEELRGTIERLESEIEKLEDDVAQMEFEIRVKSRSRVVAKRSVSKDYDEALRLYNIRQYKESLFLFGKLDNSRTPIDLRDNVLFWVGQCYFMMEDYENATEKFNAVIEKYKRGNKVFDAMYMLGISYNKLGEKSKALNYFEKALNDGPPFEIRKKIEMEIRKIEG